MRRNFKPEKWLDNPAIKWWEGLDIDNKRRYKLHYEKLREWNAGHKFSQYPNMYDTTHLRISQLSLKQIHRIWVFHEHTIPNK